MEYTSLVMSLFGITIPIAEVIFRNLNCYISSKKCKSNFLFLLLGYRDKIDN